MELDNIIVRPKCAPIIPPITLLSGYDGEWLELPFCKIHHIKLRAKIMKARKDFMDGKKELRRFKTVHFSSMLVGEKATLGAEFTRREWAKNRGYDIDITFKREFVYTNPQRHWRKFYETARYFADHNLDDSAIMNGLSVTLMNLQRKLNDMVVHRNKFADSYEDTHGEYAPKED